MGQRALSLIVLLAVVILIAVLLPYYFDFSSGGAVVTASAVEDGIYRLVNEERREAGLTALSRDSWLDTMAKEYAASGHSLLVELSSDIHYLMCNCWWVTYAGGSSPQLRENTAREQVDYCLEIEDFRETMLRSDARATGVGVATVGDKVYYTQVFDVLNAGDGKGEPVALQENAVAEDPSWEELKEFLRHDDTDEQLYMPGLFVCADFANMLHDRAESLGIRAAYVSVDFVDGPGHAMNAFDTIDKGRVYIDCTGPGLNVAVSGELLGSHDIPVSYDKVAYIASGQEYGLISLDQVYNFEYDFYERWTQDWEDYHTKVELYNQTSDPEEQEALLWELELLQLSLGDYRWEPLGTVERFYVHW